MFVKKKQNPEFVLVPLELRTDAALVLRDAAEVKRVRFETYLSDLLLEAAKKQAFDNLKSPPVNR